MDAHLKREVFLQHSIAMEMALFFNQEEDYEEIFNQEEESWLIEAKLELRKEE